MTRQSVALDGSGGCIAEARRLATAFLARAGAEYGLSVSDRAVSMAQLVVSELVTNARKYAPGPLLMELGIAPAWVEVVVWDSAPVLPVAQAADPGRVGQHGLEIVMAVVQSFEVRRETVGKRITVRIALQDDPEGDLVQRPLS
ncbi:ATP-binding protein [Streptomyces asoensis]|uniref:ATP-binding protein n=1 Tax=Streptomyces asoensis TaxID=249586 RepID=UPI0033E10494